MFTALRAASLTITETLRQAFEADLPALFGPAAAGAMQITLNTPEEMNANGVSVWLYRVVRDEQRLNAPPRRISPDQMQVEPLPLRLHYLVTPIVDINTAASPETEQVILGKVMQTFHDTPQLRGVQLQDDFQGTDLELTIRLETLSLEEITRVWEALQRAYQLSVSYEVSVVPVSSAQPSREVAPVEVVIGNYAAIVDAG
jgi:hypothetical protein